MAVMAGVVEVLGDLVGGLGGQGLADCLAVGHTLRPGRRGNRNPAGRRDREFTAERQVSRS